jgi:hypothetical protein
VAAKVFDESYPLIVQEEKEVEHKNITPNKMGMQLPQLRYCAPWQANLLMRCIRSLASGATGRCWFF